MVEAVRGTDTDRVAVVALDAARARDPELVGPKAANLARAAAAGLPVLPGFALVPARLAPDVPHGERAVRAAWRAVAGTDGDPRTENARPLVVRSSSVHEDGTGSSMAGRFTSVLDVRDWDAFGAAVRTVLDSAAAYTEADIDTGPEIPRPGHGMAVLVQPMLRTVAGGVLFSADPVAGRTDRMLVSAVHGGPDRLVDGSTQGTRYRLTRHGRLLETDPGTAAGASPGGERATGDARAPLDGRALRRLVRLARRAEWVFGGPQDIEFGFGADGALWLFQSRPITAIAALPPRGARLLGPGPVAETFPRVLQPLEEDLWLTPMAHGLAVAVDTAGAAPRAQLRRVPLARTVDGRAAADLRLLGAAPPARPLLRLANPAHGTRRLLAAWRMGRLRNALPLLAVDLMADVDRQLAELPAPAELSGGQLLDALSWGRAVLSPLHAQESLAGSLLGHGTGATAAGEALAVLAETRARTSRSAGAGAGPRQGAYARDGDAELIARHPVLLALLPPSLGARDPLPAPSGWSGVPRGVAALPVREGLRLRVRWVQEMQRGVVRELARRLVATGALPAPERVARLRWPELSAADGVGLPADLAERLPRPGPRALPAAFRLAGGRPRAEPAAGGGPAGRTGGRGAGGGLGTGTAWDGRGARPADAVLVVRVLDPSLAALLPGLAGLVAETGSVLSHLAVLAREQHVPTVVDVPGAPDRFPPGTGLSVDGTTGAVERTDGAAPAGTRPTPDLTTDATPDASRARVPASPRPHPHPYGPPRRPPHAPERDGGGTGGDARKGAAA
ncbi:PEP/pyruvate-binding domain-containing protein [Streptomyces sp. NPDC054784]